MTERASVTLRVWMTPPACLLPNAARRTHWATKGREARAAREAVSWSVIGSGLDLPRLEGVVFAGPVRVRAVIAWEKGRHRCDFDAAVAALKPMLDGLADIFVVDDDKQIRAIEVEQIRDSEGRGYTELTVLAADAAGEETS
jgi:hypothetical protein